MILRGTGLNFGNDPFATVEEGGGGGVEEEEEKKKARREWENEGKRSRGRRREIGAREIGSAHRRRGRGGARAPLIGGHYLNHVKRQNCIYLFK